MINRRNFVSIIYVILCSIFNIPTEGLCIHGREINKKNCLLMSNSNVKSKQANVGNWLQSKYRKIFLLTGNHDFINEVQVYFLCVNEIVIANSKIHFLRYFSSGYSLCFVLLWGTPSGACKAVEMAKFQINTKSRSYLRDKEAFLKDLRQFNESKNITVKPPVINGIEIDLYLFYTLVQQRGGLGKVNQNDVWETFLRPLRLPHPCVNGSTLLRRIYGAHLEKYERAKGPPGRDDDMEFDEDSRRGRGNMPRITFSSGTYISASGETLRTATKPSPAPSERLALSLLSPMPNEQDFAVNVCTVLAADHSNRLPLATTPHILDFLLAHAGVYNHSSLRETIGRSYFEARGRYPDDFWKLRAGGGGARELADETKFMQVGVEQPELMVQAMAAHNNLTDCLLRDDSDDDSSEKAMSEIQDILEDWVTEPSEESSLFAPELPGGASCVYTQRVLQIASIVRSLSFHDENIQYLARNTTLIRFLLLCANCWVGTLRQSGLDTLGNVSTELIIRDPATCLISRHILSTIQSALVSPDRARVLAALELLNKLAQNEANEEALLKSLESKVYHDVCALLTLRDIMVLVCTLECVYALTSLGDRASEAVARVPGLVHTLVSLVTVEAQSYGPRACILMRVVETVSGPAALAAVADSQQQAQPPPPPQPQPQPQPPPQMPQTKPVSEPVRAASPSPATPASAPAAPVSTLQLSHMQQRTVQENEHFAQAWLRSSFEPLPAHDNSTFDSAELYRLYLACCAKLARKGVIAPAHFPRLVRTVFGGTVGPNTVTNASGESQQVYVGIRSRTQQNRANPAPASPASPILKAQLTNKPGAEVKVAVSQPQPQQPATHPHLSQALESNPTNTTLIKHLLAHKVSPASPQTQVAQRQQNQQRVPAVSNNVQPPSQAMEVDPEAMIKCTAITPGGIASITPAVQDKIVVCQGEDMLVPKDEPVQIQIDEQSQLTIKTTQNKMLADLLEKKSNPPVQVVQMGSSINAPTIQITETGQIVHVKPETPVIQINEAGVVSQGNQFFQIKNEQGQLIQIKNEQGQIIQLKTDQLQQLQFKNEQIVQIKPDNQIGQMHQSQIGQIHQNITLEKDAAEYVGPDHSFTEPPSKKIKMEEKKENAPQESVSKTAANLYAALAASALEDEEDLLMPPQPKQEPVEVIQQSVLENASVIIQEPILQVQQPTMQVQQPTMQIQQPTMQVQGNTIQVQQPTMQVQQPMLQVQPMDVQNIIASQSGQIILQEKSIPSQPQYVQQPMQIIATPSTSQGGLSYITQNIPTNMMQKTIIIVQGPTGGGPLTLTVNNPGGLDEATLNSLIAQATEAITQQQIIQNTGIIQSAQRVIMQPTLVSTSQPICSNTGLIQSGQRVIMGQPTLVSTPTSSNAGLIQSAQRVIMGQSTLVSTSQPISSNSGIIQSTQRVIMTPQSTLVSASQPASNSGVIQTGQRVIMSQPTLVSASQPIVSNTGIIQSTQRVIMSPQPTLVSTSLPIVSSTPQMTASQQPMITTQPQPLKAQIVNQPQHPQQQIVVTQKNPPALISTSTPSNQQIIVSNNQQIVMNSSMKTVGHRVVQPQRTQVINVQNQVVHEKVTTKNQQPLIRQVISRQPIMVGNTKIGDKETVVTQPAVEQKPIPPPSPSPVLSTVIKPAPAVTPPPSQSSTTPEDTPWVCHWRGCGKSFGSASSVFSHCARVHCPGGAAGEAPCQWADCDRVPRRTFALLNHLSDKHCTQQALKAIYNSRRQAAAEAEASKPVTLGYPPNAALAALNKHAADMFNPRELMDENEGPVTKSIRLTAALILRNIVIYSNTGRRQLRSYEAHLACIALSSVEASRTISQVLYDMNNI